MVGAPALRRASRGIKLDIDQIHGAAQHVGDDEESLRPGSGPGYGPDH